MKRVTLSDVAARAGVSRSAASLAVRGTGRLSDETRTRVRQVMADLGYVYHRGAATLRTRRSSVVGMIVTDISNPFFAEMTLGFERTLSEAGLMTVLTNTFDDPDRFRELVQVMLEQPVDALVYVPVAGVDLSFARAAGVPPALAATRQPSIDVPFIGPDDRHGGRVAAEHLLTVHGSRRLAYLGGPESAGPRGHRLSGVRDAVAAHDDAEVVIQLPGVTGTASGVELAERLVASGASYDAVVCHSDVIAFSLCHVLQRHGLRVPEDVAVVGFDGLDLGAVFRPTISSVTVDPEGLGRATGSWIVGALEGRDQDERTVVVPQLVARESCGC